MSSAGKLQIIADPTAAAQGDSIAAYLTDVAGTMLTSTLVGGAQSLDVNVTQSALPAGAATQTTLAAVLAELQLIDNVDGAVWAAGSMGIEALAVRKDATGPLTGVADGDFSPLQVDANGNLKVSASIDFAGDYAEDSAHVTGDVGLFSLGIRNDNAATSLTNANGDYTGFATDAKGALYTRNVNNGSNLQQIMTVGTTATLLPAAALASRTSLFVQMLSSGKLYLGSATVTNSGATRGLMIGNGGFVTLEAGPANGVYGVADAAGKDVAVWEFA